MIGGFLSDVRETAQTARQWLSFVRALPALVLLRLSTVTDVSARAWRNAVVTVIVGIVASAVTLVLLRRSA